ncbi:MAG TPA: glycerophosphodiester phosphodiesterase [Acidimicrobiales bacterium]|nr:glycerophosphodiester phosphodiesterase [Acidimicrobiales bacterium]
MLGHRGDRAHHPDNSAAAFTAALEAGADGVELDVRATADGRLAVHHDAAIEGLGVIAELSREALPPGILDLVAALDTCAGMGVNIEIKANPTEPDAATAPWLAEQVVELVTTRGLEAWVVVSSFSLATIDRVHELAPAIPTGWLTAHGYDHTKAVGTAADRGHVALHPYFTGVTEELVAAAHEAGLALATWTVDDPDTLRRFAAWGVDAVICDDPAAALAVLRG